MRRARGHTLGPIHRSRPLLFATALIIAFGCHDGSPSAPSGPLVLSGSWQGTLPWRNCVEDWSTVTLILRQTGRAIEGQLQPVAGPAHVITGSVAELSVDLSSPDLFYGMCTGYSLQIDSFEFDGGRVTAFSGRAGGICCGTIIGSFRLRRIV